MSPIGFRRLWKEICVYKKHLGILGASSMSMWDWNTQQGHSPGRIALIKFNSFYFHANALKYPVRLQILIQINHHWRCGSEVWLTAIPTFQGENPNYNGLLLFEVFSPIFGGKKYIKSVHLVSYLATVVVFGCWVGKMYPPLRCSPIFSAGVSKLCHTFLTETGSPLWTGMEERRGIWYYQLLGAFSLVLNFIKLFLIKKLKLCEYLWVIGHVK